MPVVVGISIGIGIVIVSAVYIVVLRSFVTLSLVFYKISHFKLFVCGKTKVSNGKFTGKVKSGNVAEAKQI